MAEQEGFLQPQEDDNKQTIIGKTFDQQAQEQIQTIYGLVLQRFEPGELESIIEADAERSRQEVKQLNERLVRNGN